MLRKQSEFEKLFMEAIDEGLKPLGEGGKQMVLFHLERIYSIKRQDIPRKPEAFAEGLEKILGSGAPVLEKLIVKTLYSKLGLKFDDQKYYAFTDYLVMVTLEEGTEEGRNLSTILPFKYHLGDSF